ncbi:hypothetical protein ABT246_12065 [Streptomyces sp. NPDC001553]|uniref:hypothetical protein n=1 Tax=Streptomyces sp. NPDC001553 TaxID=3154385 RepID=UPI003320366B
MTAAVIGLLAVPGCTVPTADVPRAATSSASSGEAVVAPLTIAQLKDAALMDADVPQVNGGMDAREGDRKPREFPPVSDPVCRTYVDVRSAEKSFARVHQIYNWNDDIYPGDTTLASYEAGAAERAFKDLKKALATCRTFEFENTTGKHTMSIVMETSPAYGDEAVTLREHTTLLAGADGNNQVTVVRAGNTIATFVRFDMGRSSSFPPELINRQVGRLNNVQQP